MPNDTKFILDACALLRWLQDEPGANRVELFLNGAATGQYQVLMHIMNLGEVIYIIAKDFGWDLAQRKKEEIGLLPISILPFSESRFWHAVELKAHHAMSYADCFAAAAAIHEQATLLTSDPEFEAVRHLITVEQI